MKLTKDSQKLISFFLKKKCIDHIEQTKKTDKILEMLYADILEASQYVQFINKKSGFYKLVSTRIQSISQIPIPEKFTVNDFPEEIRKNISETSNTHLHYSFSLFGRIINIHFLIEDIDTDLYLQKYNKYVDQMLIWLYIVNQYASTKCSKEISIYIYLTDLFKRLPDSNVEILGTNNVNTAFTNTCQKISEIVIYRKEEWFKVFMHESFHNFALDFSDMNVTESHSRILQLFPVKSRVNLYEAYAEFWAEIMNACFCSFLEMEDKTNIEEFLSHVHVLIHFERTFSFFQMVKALDFMGLQYKHLYSSSSGSEVLRETLYKEDTSVLSYYVIKTILLNNYQGFLAWCESNNTSLLQFKKSLQNQQNFCAFIEKNYKTKSFLDGVKCTEKVLVQLKNKSKIEKDYNLDFLVKNMRMSICELG